MRILAFDTALGACSAAVLCVEGDQRKLAHAYETRARGHAEALMPMIEQVMGEAGVDYADLDRIAITTGPGTFTGARVGIATARGLALAASLPLIGETTLAVMAHAARARLGERALAVAVDARRDQIYFQQFDRAGAALGDPVVIAPEAAAALLRREAALAVGSGAQALVAAADRPGLSLEAAWPDLQPDAAALAEMALTRTPGDAPVRPLYLRPPDARPQVTPAMALRQ